LLGFPAFTDFGAETRKNADAYANRLAAILTELRGAYRALLGDIWEQLAEATGVWGEPTQVKAGLSAQAAALQGRVLEPRLNAFVAALARPLDENAWVENVAMVVADGQAPRVWADELAARFTLLIADLGGAFRRVQALLYERLADSDDAYRSRRITLTMPDGREKSQVLVLSERDRAEVGRYLNPVLEQLAQVFGSQAAACQTVLAHLATADDEVSGMEAPAVHGVREAYYD
jgi:hypothetical protein